MTRVVGAVLVGGASTRMGTDKASLVIDGVAMARRVADALEEGGAERVVVVGNNRSAADLTWLDAVADRWPGEGPLGGLATALLHGGAVGAEQVVVAACDQPDLTAPVIAALLEALSGAAPEVVGAAARTIDGRRHPFPSAWRTVVGPALEALVDGGARRAEAAFELGRVVEIDVDPSTLIDLDTPDDLAGWQDERR